MDFTFFIKNFQVLLLVFMRITGMFVVAPFFSSFLIPIRTKIILAIFISFIIYPVLTKFNPVIPSHMINYGLLVIEQLFIGIILGFISSIIFTAFQMAGQFFSFQMGFGINQVYDPLSQIQIPIIGQLQYLIAIMVFLVIGGDRLLLNALYKSFEILPLLDFSNIIKVKFLAKSLSKIFSSMFLLALEISFPVLATMFLVSLIMGLLAKASPQMNLFMVGFSFQIGIGLIALIIIMPYLIDIMNHVIKVMYNDLIRFIYGISIAK